MRKVCDVELKAFLRRVVSYRQWPTLAGSAPSVLPARDRRPVGVICPRCDGLAAHRRLLFSGHDQRTGVVVDSGAGGVQGGEAGPVVVAAQQQVYRVRAPAARGNNDRDHWPGRAAAGAVGKGEPPGPFRQLIVGRDGTGTGGAREPTLHETSSQ